MNGQTTTHTRLPQRFRLQFSLRMILLMMALVGVALTIYRWPWVESDFAYQTIGDEISGEKARNEFERRITYHRDWRGRAVKHGVEQSLLNGKVWHEAHYYDGELNGRRRVWNGRGGLAIEAHYLDGLLHGAFRCGNGEQWQFEGQYAGDKMHGEWRIIASPTADFWLPDLFSAYVDANGQPPYVGILNSIPDDAVRIVANYRQHRLHGRTTWSTLDGELINAAEYADDEIVSWNGQPIVEQFWSWLQTCHDPRLESFLKEARAKNWQRQNAFVDDDLVFVLESGDRLQIHAEMFDFHEIGSNSRSLASALCEYAAKQGLRFDYRFGGLWLVSGAADPSPPFVDPTGVGEVQFEPNSAQQHVWDGRIDVHSHEGRIASCLAHVLPKGKIEFQGVEPNKYQYADSFEPAVLFTRRRRDVVAYILLRTGYRCEQHGNTLHISPRFKNPQSDRPLAAPRSFSVF